MITLELQDNKYLIPENGYELSVKNFERVTSVIRENTVSGITQPFTKQMVLDITSIVTGIYKDIIMDLPSKFFDYLVTKIKWVFFLDMRNFPLKDFIEIDNERYTYERSEDITTREWVDIDTILKTFSNEDKNAAILAVRVRKELYEIKQNKDDKGNVISEEKLYTGAIEKYDSELIEKRLNTFKELPVAEIFPMLSFFLSNEKMFAINTKIYSVELAQALFNQRLLYDWARSGDGHKRLSNYRKKIYWRWMQFLTKELRKHAGFYHTQLIKEMPNVTL